MELSPDSIVERVFIYPVEYSFGMYRSLAPDAKVVTVLKISAHRSQSTTTAIASKHCANQ